MTFLGASVSASCVPVPPTILSAWLGQTRLPSTSLSTRYSPSWPLRVRLNIDTPPLVGFTPANGRLPLLTPGFACSYKRSVSPRKRPFATANSPVFSRIAHRRPRLLRPMRCTLEHLNHG
jgi:hypothetical protein